MPRKSWWARLPFGVRMTAGTSALLLAIGGAVAGVAALVPDSPDAPRIVTAVGGAEPRADAQLEAPPAPAPPALPPKPGLDPAAALSRTTDEADRTATRQPHRPATGTPHRAATTTKAPAITKTAPAPVAPESPAQPSITTRTDVETREVPFQTRFVRDPSLPRGARKVQAAGVPGEETLRYLVTLTDGQETDRKLMDITVTREPQDRVIVFGSRRGFDRPRHGGRGRGECGKKLDLCVPLGRKAQAYCPQEQPVELLDLDALEALPQMDCAPEAELPTLPR